MGRGKWNTNEKEPFLSKFIRLYTLNELNYLHVYHTSIKLFFEKEQTPSQLIFSTAWISTWHTAGAQELCSTNEFRKRRKKSKAHNLYKFQGWGPTPSLQQQFQLQSRQLKNSNSTALIVSYAPVFTIGRGGRAGAQFSFLNINF